jgi:phage-related protein
MSELKPITWLVDSRIRLREAQQHIRARVGQELQLVQRGATPKDFRPMPDVGPGTMEIRVHGESEYRVFYVASFEEAVYVLHCFGKKTQRTRKGDLNSGRQRYQMMIEMRRTK